MGASIQWFMDLSRAVPNWWFSLNTALVRAEHALNPFECGGCIGVEDNIHNACEAFNNSLWCAGKLFCGKLKKFGLDDIQLKLGYDFKSTERTHGGIYGIVSVPTGNCPTAQCIFEPLIGSRHVGLGVGIHYDHKLGECNNRIITLLLDLRYRYLFAAFERRLFDLNRNGDWSRYLQVVRLDQPLDINPVPVVNFLYFDALVRPQSTIDLWAALHYEYHHINLEIGYNFWWRAREKGSVCTNFKEGYSIFDLSGGCSPTFTCAPDANISQGADGTNAVVSSTDCNELTLSDICVDSAMHPAVLSNKVYAAISYQGQRESCLTLV